jgi:hypothetical protein
MNISVLLLCLACCTACGTQVSESLLPADPLTYRVDYMVKPRLMDGTVEVTLTLSQGKALLREITMRPDSRVTDIKADGVLEIGDAEVRWIPPASGGRMSWRVNVANQRNDGGYDAWLGMDWGLFRAEDIIPRAATRTLKKARSETWLTLQLPTGWTAVTQYFSKNGQIRIDNPERRFDQPSGWIVLGDLGIRRENIAGMRVAVAGPTGQSVRRMDALALLNWTMPELERLLPDLPARLTIVIAGDPMWRGGLSAPLSLFVHADRPLISENGTSTLLHEIMHLTLAINAADGYDWIAEGLAEYYSLQLLHRSGTISNSRFARAKADLAEWATAASSLCRRTSTGATTALAVGILTALDEDIRQLSAGESSLDDVVRELTQLEHSIDLYRLSDISQRVAGGEPDTLHIENLPGCRKMDTGSRET